MYIFGARALIMNTSAIHNKGDTRKTILELYTSLWLKGLKEKRNTLKEHICFSNVHEQIGQLNFTPVCFSTKYLHISFRSNPAEKKKSSHEIYSYLTRFWGYLSCVYIRRQGIKADGNRI